MLQPAHVVVHGGAHLDDIRIRKDGAHELAHSELVDAEKVGLVRTGKLQERDIVMRHVRGEHRTCLRIETYHLLGHQICYGLGIFKPRLFNNMDFSRECSRRQFLYLLREDTNFEHTNLVSG